MAAKKHHGKALLVGLLVALAIFVTLWAVPASAVGISSYNVTVTVQSYDLASLLFGITSVGVTTNGPASILDVALASFGTGLALSSLLQTTWTMTVCVGHVCSSQTASTWFPTFNIFQEQVTATDHFGINGVPGGQQPVAVTLSNTDGIGEGSTTWAGSACVGC